MSEYTCLQCTQDCHGESAHQARTIRRWRDLAYRLREKLRTGGPKLDAMIQDYWGEWSGGECENCGRADYDGAHTWEDCAKGLAIRADTLNGDVEAATMKERARIVAALRVRADSALSYDYNDWHTILTQAADAIERGEL